MILFASILRVLCLHIIFCVLFVRALVFVYKYHSVLCVCGVSLVCMLTRLCNFNLKRHEHNITLYYIIQNYTR